jgi:thiamine biosynthesis lipoprotein
MTRTELIMGMPITVAIPDREALDREALDRAACRFPTLDAAGEAVFQSFREVDERFSPYKETSETSRIDRGELDPDRASPEMREVLELAEDTRRRTDGYFDVRFNGRFDPSGLVKGWAIWRAARILDDDGFVSFCIEAGGDIEVRGANDEGRPWVIGIRSPFDPSLLVRRLRLPSCGIATSGTYIRGEHIWNPRTGKPANEIASLTVIGPNVYEADRFATAAFAMGPRGMEFMAGLGGFEAYMVDAQATALYTPGFARYLAA